jgi:hypothetical protein
MHQQQRSYRTSRQAVSLLLLGLTVLLASSCDEPSRTVAPTKPTATTPNFTLGSGSTPTLIGQATYADFPKVKRMAKDWQVDLNVKGGLKVFVRSFDYAVNSYTGWHKHPGPVLIQVIQGTVTFFMADHPCTPIVVHAGEGYLDDGVGGHIGKNLSGAPAKDVTIYLVPPGTQLSQLRIDMPAPHGADACP